jgi:hypothetical protein
MRNNQHWYQNKPANPHGGSGIPDPHFIALTAGSMGVHRTPFAQHLTVGKDNQSSNKNLLGTTPRTWF